MPTSMPRKSNPYVIGRPIYERELFFGRDDLFEFLRDVLEKGARVVLLHGQRRIGKSTVLRQIPVALDLPDFLFVQFDLQDQARCTLARVLANLAAEIARHPALAATAVTPPTEESLAGDPHRFATVFLAALAPALAGRRLVLLLDEFDVLKGAPGDGAREHFFPFLRAISTSVEWLYVVAVIGRRLDELPHMLGMFREAPHREIGLLDERSARQLITRPAEGQLAYRADAIDAILKLSAGHPYFTQLLCHSLFAHARSEGTGEVTADDVPLVIADAIEGGEAGLTWFRDGLPACERVVFTAVAAAQGDAGEIPLVEAQMLLESFGVEWTDGLEAAGPRLIEWHFLSDVTPGVARGWDYGYPVPKVRVTVELVRLWLVKRYPLRREVWSLAGPAPATNDDIEHLRGRLARDRNDFHALFALAEALADIEEFAEAEPLYRRAHLLDPLRARDGFVRALAGRARELEAQGKFDAAERCYSEALQIEPEHKVARVRLTRVAEQARQVRAAKNPFVIGQAAAPASFVGRSKEISMIASQILGGGSVAIVGPPGFGKTSLLRYVASPEMRMTFGPDMEKLAFVYIDCRAITPLDARSFWREVAKHMEGVFGARVENDQPELLVPFIKMFNRRAVLLFDDFDVALASPEIAAGLRHLVGGDVSVVVALQRDPYLIEPTSPASPLHKHMAVLHLGPLAETDVNHYILSKNVDLTGAQRDWLKMEIGGNPYLLPAALSVVYQLQAERRPFDDQAASEALHRLADGYLASVWRSAAPRERAFLLVFTISTADGGEPVGSMSLRGTSMPWYSRALGAWILRHVTAAPAAEIDSLKTEISEYLDAESAAHLWRVLDQLRTTSIPDIVVPKPGE